MKQSLEILKRLQSPSGLFSAAPSDDTGYSRAWIRDNLYAILGFEAVKDIEPVKKAMHALLDILIRHEYKIDEMIKSPEPKAAWRYIHARYDPITGDEIYEEWGNKQNDATGFLLFKIADLEDKGIKVIRNINDLRILQKLVWYLNSVEYWHDADNGIWEEYEEVHASSVGACVSGLKKISKYVKVPEELIKKGQETLDWLLPRESETKDVDLALLSLIYPYNVVSDEIRDQILENVETKLARKKGIIRYEKDVYYDNNGKEAEWVFGFPWLAIIYKNLGDRKKFKLYLDKSKDCMNSKGELPELYLGGTNEHNANTPLGWTQSLFVVASN